MRHFSATQQCRRLRAAGAALLCASLLVPAAATAPTQAATTPAAPARAVIDVRAEQWWLDVLGVERIWAEHTRGKGVVVAVLDDGVEPGGDLEGAVLPGFTSAGDGRGDVGDGDNFHGTRMATKIAGRGTGPGLLGMAPEATILPVKLPSNSAATQALEVLAAMDDPPEVVNMSFGGAGECPPDLLAAVRAAVDRGMILVASVGNAGNASATAGYPAGCPGVISVGAYGYYGNTPDGGSPVLRVWDRSETQPYLTLVAPGVRMLGFTPGDPDPSYYDGTSDAAAIASGSFALVRGAFPDMPSRELVARVLASTFPLEGSAPPGTRAPEWGYGSIRPRGAIEDKIPADAPNPVYDALDEAVSDGTASPDSNGSPGGAGSSGGTDGGSGSSSSGNGAGNGTTAVPESREIPSASDDSAASIALVAGGGVLLVVLLVAGLSLVLILRRRANPGPASTGWPQQPPPPDHR